MKHSKEKLFRKENNRAIKMGKTILGGEYAHDRRTKKDTPQKNGKMRSKNQGLDYTPLYRFLLSKVGCVWDDVFSEAKARLNTAEPIFAMVAQNANEKQDYFRGGDNTYWSGLYVDEQGLLQKVNPNFTGKNIEIPCTCCTYSFNGKAI